MFHIWNFDGDVDGSALIGRPRFDVQDIRFHFGNRRRYFGKHSRTIFSEIDGNGDGQISQSELESFLTRTRQQGKRCVLVVHGRGLHSKDQVPVLKDALKRWMGTARFARLVLAFATARPHDGGAGAVYVLLKK